MGDLGDEEMTSFDEVGDGDKPYHFSVVPFKVEQHLEFIDISEDGHLLLGSSNLVVRNWNGSVWLFKNADVQPVKEESICGRGFDSSVACGSFLDGWERVIVGDDSGTLTVLKVNEYENGCSYFLPFLSATHHDSEIASLCLTNSRKSTITAGTTDLRINVWDNNLLELQEKYCPAHSAAIRKVLSAFEPDSELFLTCGADRQALIWDPRQPRPANGLFESRFGLSTMCWLSEYSLALGNLAGGLELIDLRNKNKFNSVDSLSTPLHHITADEKGLLAVCGDSHVIKVWDTKSNEVVYTSLAHSGLVRGLAWNPTNGHLYSCGFDQRLISHPVTSVPSTFS